MISNVVECCRRYELTSTKNKMKRVYLDSNIYRFIKDNKRPLYTELGKLLEKYSDRLLYFYSHAHLLDLERDKSEKKYDDLRFMEKFVKDNYLVLLFKEKYVKPLIATPIEAFEGIDNSEPIEELLDLDKFFGEDDFSDLPMRKNLSNLVKTMLDFPLRMDLEKHMKLMPQKEQELFQKIIPNAKDNYTIRDLLKQFGETYNSFYEDKRTYKALRRYSIESLNLTTKYNIDINDINFNKNLENTPLQKSFLEFVEQSLSYNESNKEQETYNFFTSAFSLLNILGIDKEPNKKAIFPNTINDAQHAFYAAHCDYLVSDDEGLILKSKVLFRLFGIETQALSVEDFVESISSIAGFEEQDLVSYIKSIRYELNHPLVLNIRLGENNRKYTTLKTSDYHFGYFNHFDIINDKETDYIVFYKKDKNYSNFVSYVEIEAVTNKIVDIFGKDRFTNGKYSETDTLAIQEGKWKGRQWGFGEQIFYIEINEGTGRFSFTIQMNKN